MDRDTIDEKRLVDVSEWIGECSADEKRVVDVSEWIGECSADVLIILPTVPPKNLVIRRRVLKFRLYDELIKVWSFDELNSRGEQELITC